MKPLPPVAFVVESDCVGCARCLVVCPTDAIVGALNLMHTVIAADCTGCELCVPECPADCIVMQPRANEPATSAQIAARWRKRIRTRRVRLTREHDTAEQSRQQRLRELRSPPR